MTTRGWNEPLPLVDANFKARMIEKTNEYLTQVTWKSNCNPETLDDAVQEAKLGNDGGYDCTMMLRPNTNDFHDWMQWSALVTYLFNRDTPYGRILSALRKTMQNNIHKYNFYLFNFI